jgi:hypothetical protein
LKAIDWKREAKRCEGIGRGEPISLARVRAMLKKSGAL